MPLIKFCVNGTPINTAVQTLQKELFMWYFAWILGVGFAVLLAILNAMWGENEAARAQAHKEN